MAAAIRERTTLNLNPVFLEEKGFACMRTRNGEPGLGKRQGFCLQAILVPQTYEGTFEALKVAL